MDWVKLAQRYYLDPAIRGLDGDLADAAEIMFVRGLARAGEVAAGGFIPEQDVELLTRRRRYEAVVNALLRSGLWKRAAGGYQVTRWTDWQDHLDALTRKRTADRERQRRRRAAVHEAGESTDDQAGKCTDQRKPETSRDMSRDVTAVEGEGEKEKDLGGSSREVSNDVVHSRDSPPVENQSQNGTSPPPRRCPRHLTDPDPPNCGACREARLAAEQWERDDLAESVARARDAPRCQHHPTEPADHCRACRSERLAAA